MQHLQNYFPTLVVETLLGRNSPKISRHERKTSTWWSGVPKAPPDSIFGIVEAFKKDETPHKINLSVGAYRDDNGKPYVLPSVLKAEEILKSKNLNKEYALAEGLSEFNSLSFDYAFGTCNEVGKKGLNATVQTLSGTGALSLFASFAKNFFPHAKTMYLPKPTWGNHAPVFKNAGLETKDYKYYDFKTFGLDYDGMLEDLCKVPEHSMVLFHACAHNPTGMDPSKEQWEELCELVKQKKLFAFFDMAYQGFATENPDNDAFAVRHFSKNNLKFAVAQSYSKNLGLYGERTGTLTVIADSQEERAKIISQLKTLIRTTYSNPPIHGARIVTEILSNSQLKKEWMAEMKGMVQRLVSIRKALRDALVKEGSKHNWDHIVKQVGMFSYTGMKPEQVDKITKEHHIYLTKDGRISIAGVTTKNVEYIACAMHQVTK
nr:aspartate aminotransferase, mitochondrial-like [Leptinotarsa decemlineata]